MTTETIKSEETVIEPLRLNIDNTTNAILLDWSNYYKSLDPSFSLDNFYLEQTDTLNFIQGNVFGIFDNEFNKVYNDFIVYSPNKEKYIDFDSYQWTIDENQTPIFSPDQEINLINLDKQTVMRIGFNGPLQWVENAFWENDTTVFLFENSSDRILRISEIDIISENIKIFKYQDTLNMKSEYSELRLNKKGLKVE